MMLVLVSIEIGRSLSLIRPRSIAAWPYCGPWMMGAECRSLKRGQHMEFSFKPASTSEEELPILALSYTGIL